MNISFRWIGGATWILTVGSLKIACDPVLCRKGHVQDYRYFKSKRLNDPVFDESDFSGIQLWLLTHGHEDHLDDEGQKMIDRKSAIIAHKSLGKRLNPGNYPGLCFLDWKDFKDYEFEGYSVRILALPAIHARNSFLGSLVGNGNGYYIEIKKGGEQFSVYITGDSVFRKSHARHFSEKSIDLIIANAGAAIVRVPFLSGIIGRITDNAAGISRMAEKLNPKLLIPVHWGTFSHYREIPNLSMFQNMKNIRIIDPGDKIAIGQF